MLLEIFCLFYFYFDIQTALGLVGVRPEFPDHNPDMIRSSSQDQIKESPKHPLLKYKRGSIDNAALDSRTSNSSVSIQTGLNRLFIIFFLPFFLFAIYYWFLKFDTLKSITG